MFAYITKEACRVSKIDRHSICLPFINFWIFRASSHRRLFYITLKSRIMIEPSVEPAKLKV